jgi:hypothetical protein
MSDNNGFNFFGFTIKRKDQKDSIRSFTPEVKDDGAVVVAAGGAYGSYIDLDGTVRTEAELVSKYREMALQPEIDKAVNEVTNEAIVSEDGKKTVELILDDLPVQDNLKKVINQEFENIIDLLDFKNNAYDVFKRWYIDGRSYYHIIIDEKRPDEGIKELRYIDPRKIRKIREVVKKKDTGSEAIIQNTRKEYYIYNERGLNYGSKVISQLGTTGVRIQPDSIIQVVSGLMDKNNTMVLSYLHPAIKPMNQLRALEDSSLIYHLSRAPERRIFYIDVGNLPKVKAEQYLREMMVKYKNKLSYDANTGEIRDDRKFMTMLEDYWLPRREGGRGTQIDVLQGGTALPQLLESVQYFEDKLYRSLQVPLSRLKPDTVYTLGRATEISRDEVNFAKFVDRVRNKFSGLFIKALEKQLILKKIATPEDWEQIKKFIRFRFLRDNYFAELKEMEIMAERMNRLRDIDDYAGKYYSHLWIRRNVLKQSDEEIEEMNEQIAEEMENPQYNQELLMQQMQQMQQQAEGNQPPPAQEKPEQKKQPPKTKSKSENKKSEGDK